MPETTARLRSLFGSGWFFEWPRGKRPLNSTWPWANVRPSLLVLWGVCWMFVVANALEVPRGPLQRQPPGGNRGPRSIQQSPSDQYYFTPSATQSPVVKSEPVARSPHPSISGDWPLFQTGADDTFNDFYTAPSPAQPIQVRVQAPEAHPFHQAESPAPPRTLGMMGRRRITTSTLSPRRVQGSLQDGRHLNLNPNASPGISTSISTSTSPNPSAHAQAARRNHHHNNNIIADAENAEWPAAASHYPHRVKRSGTETPEFSGVTLGHQGFGDQQQQQHDRNTRYYDSLRHHPPPYYPPPPAPLPPVSRPSSNYPHYTPVDDDDMSLTYEATPTFSNYPPLQEQDGQYPSPPQPLSENHPYPHQGINGSPVVNMEMELPTKEDSDPGGPNSRVRPIPKPDREVTKGEDGRFVCTWEGCVEDVKTFNRRCEWSKHMDKHDRPYKCPAEGCEKLPGFTYSGGLLRHQREVHNLHGGPRKQLNCPHPNCKRHSGKGFSRQENLNEHLRRVHTDTEHVENGGGGDETEDEASERTSVKRKRGPVRGDEGDLRTEMARLRTENEELRRQSELQNQQTQELMRQLQNLQALVGSRIGQGQAPQALM